MSPSLALVPSIDEIQVRHLMDIIKHPAKRLDGESIDIYRALTQSQGEITDPISDGYLIDINEASTKSRRMIPYPIDVDIYRASTKSRRIFPYPIDVDIYRASTKSRRQSTRLRCSWCACGVVVPCWCKNAAAIGAPPDTPIAALHTAAVGFLLPYMADVLYNIAYRNYAALCQ